MKGRLLDILIVILVFLVAGAFYLYWGAEKKEPDISSKTSEVVDANVDSALTEEDKLKEYNQKYYDMAMKIKEKDHRGDLEKEEEKMMKELVEPSIMTVEEIEEKAEEVYDELLPEEFDSDVEVMDDALNELDIKLDEIDNKMMLEEQTMNVESIENNENSDELENMEQLLVDPSEEEIVNDDEYNVDDEDVNNLEDSESIELVEDKSDVNEEAFEDENLINEGGENEVI